MAKNIAKKVLVDLDFNGNHIKNVGMEVLEKDPSPFETRFYINSKGYVRLYFNKGWHDVAYISNIKEVQDYAQRIELRVSAIEDDIERFDDKISSLSQSDKSINESINQIKSDNHISPNEKKILNNLWDDMNAEYSQIIDEAARYDVDVQDYATAYDKAVAAFRKYTNTGIDYILIEPDFDDISAYYLERSIVQGSINAKIKGGISEADAAADAAQRAADKAVLEAEDAKNTLDRWASDNVISPVEKFSLKNEKAKAEADYVDIRKQTEKYMLADEVTLWNAFDNAYRAYTGKIDTIAAEPGDSDVDNLQELQASYYNARTAILAAIASAAKKIADDAAKDAETAKQIAENALITAAGAQSFIDSTITPEIETLNRRLDGVVENWFYDYSPTSNNYPASEWLTENEKTNHIGDTFTNTQEYFDDAMTPDAGKSWRWIKDTDGTFLWTPIADSDAVRALQEAAKAKSTADGKNRTFYNVPSGPYDKGDLWVQGEAGDIMVCIKSRHTGYLASDWAKASKYTDDTAALEAKKEAEAAQVTADNAKYKAEEVKSDLEKMASDNIISPVEKTALIQQKADMMSEYAQIIASANKYAVTATEFESSYESAIAALDKYTANPTQDTDKEPDFNNIAAYYTSRQTILDSIAEAAKKNADDTAKLAERAKAKADDAEVKAEAAKSEAAAALANAKAALADVAKLNDDNYFSIAENVASKR